MKKYLIVLAFFGLLEYQAVFYDVPREAIENHWLAYSAVTAIGLIILCLYQLYTGSKDFVKKNPKTKKNKKVQMLEIAAIVLYLAIIAGSSLTGSFGSQFVIILAATIAGLGGVSVYEVLKRRKEPHKKILIFEKPSKVDSTRMSAFTIPILYLYVVNFLTAAQIGNNLAFQFILFLSCIILYDNLNKEEQFVQKFSKKVDDFELRHYIFHRWSKYFDFFLGTWYFTSLHLNGVISLYAMLALMFLYMCIFFTVLLRITYHFNIRDFIGILTMSATLTIIPAMAYSALDWYPPSFIVAAFIFFGFDLGDIYWHSKHFAHEHKASLLFWFQKATIYGLVLVFIWQLHQMETNPLMSVDNVYTSVFGAPQQEIVPGPTVEPLIQVVDMENATHVRGG